MFDLLILDLDNTIYPVDSGLFAAVDININRYLVEFVDLDPDEVDFFRTRYKEIYGLTLIGLMRHHKVDPYHYLAYVHDLDVNRYLSADLELNSLLAGVGIPMVTLTNGSREYAGRVVKALGIHKRFEDLIGIEDIKFIPKPHPEAFLSVIRPRGLQPHQCLMVDDLEQNLQGAKNLGMRTGLVHPKKGTRPGPWDLAAPDIKTLLKSIQEAGKKP